MAIEKLEAVIEAKDLASKKLEDAAKKVDAIGKNAGKAGFNFEDMGKKIGKIPLQIVGLHSLDAAIGRLIQSSAFLKSLAVDAFGAVGGAIDNLARNTGLMKTESAIDKLKHAAEVARDEWIGLQAMLDDPLGSFISSKDVLEDLTPNEGELQKILEMMDRYGVNVDAVMKGAQESIENAGFEAAFAKLAVAFQKSGNSLRVLSDIKQQALDNMRSYREEAEKTEAAQKALKDAYEDSASELASLEKVNVSKLSRMLEELGVSAEKLPEALKEVADDARWEKVHNHFLMMLQDLNLSGASVGELLKEMRRLTEASGEVKLAPEVVVATRGFAEGFQSIEDEFGQLAEIGKSTAQTIAGSFDEFFFNAFETRIFRIQDLLASLSRGLLRILTQQAGTGITSLIGGLFGSGSSTSGTGNASARLAGGNNIQIVVNAVDSHSVAQLAAAHPEVIANSVISYARRTPQAQRALGSF